jgi:HEAT repeat protein
MRFTGSGPLVLLVFVIVWGAMPMPGESNELEMHLQWALSPMGGAPDLRQKEVSIRYLLSHADAAYPRLAAALESKPDALDAPAIIQLLPRFQRAESVPLLERILLHGRETSAHAAGVALGQLPLESATHALVQALSSSRSETLMGAIDGLPASTAPAVCPALRKLLHYADVTVRYYAVRSAARLHCLEAHDWEDLEHDSDESIRDLVRQLRQAGVR